jgi:SSS family solute:Na+ symporter
MITGIILSYLAVVLIIGSLSHRLFRGTGEDYFVASRTIGPFVLLMSLFGTNMTSFALLGASGEAYHEGIGVFALMGSSSALVIPCVFFFIGTRIWSIGKRHGVLTQVQYFRRRWDSDGLGLVLFIVLIALLIPYLLIGVMGGGITMNLITGGQVPTWVGGLLVCAVVLTYVCYGGMRGTAWVNTFQTLVFMILGGVTFFVIVDRMGGFSHAMGAVADAHPELLIRGDLINPITLLTYTLIPLSVGMFPHMFTHWLTAKSVQTFRYPLMFYPLCMTIVWLPSVLIGILGTVDFPDLEGTAANSILVRMIQHHAPGVLAGLLGAGVFAAIMSSLDSQVLSIGNMFTQDIVRHYGFHDQMSEKKQILFGRVFVCLVLALTYILSLVSDRSIFGLAIWSFTGYSALFPVVAAALFWKRSTKHGAFAAVLSVVVMWIYFFIQGWQMPQYTVGGTGVMPVVVILAVSTTTMVVVSLLTRPPKASVVQTFFKT